MVEDFRGEKMGEDFSVEKVLEGGGVVNKVENEDGVNESEVFDSSWGEDDGVRMMLVDDGVTEDKTLGEGFGDYEKMAEDGGVGKMVEDGGAEKEVEDDNGMDESKACDLSRGEDNGVGKFLVDDGVTEDKSLGEEFGDYEKMVKDGGVGNMLVDDGVTEDKYLGEEFGDYEKMVKDGGVGKMLVDDGVAEDKYLGEEFGDYEKLVEDGGVGKMVEDGVENKVQDEDGIIEFKAGGVGKMVEDGVENEVQDEDGIIEFKAGGVGKMVEDGVENKVQDEDGIIEFKAFDSSQRADDGVGKITVDDGVTEDKSLGEGLGVCVGDIVWAKTKIKTWWPGRIHDPLDAAEYGMVSDREGCLLVGYFGMNHVAWCPRYQIKPFAQYYEQISGKSKAKIFVGAVEKALEEFGGRVKLNMTCSCVLKQNRPTIDDSASKEGVPVPGRNCSELGEFSVTHFDSAKFLTQLKHLAQIVSKVGVLDFTVTESRLSAFYSSTGHSQLPMHLLHEGNDAERGADGILPKQTEENVLLQEQNKGNEGFAKVFGGGITDKTSISCSKSMKRKMKRDSEIEETTLMISPPVKDSNASSIGNGYGGIEGMNEIGAESRERKKSRYLSYPYVNWRQKGLYAEGMAATTDGGMPTNFKSTGEKFWRKWYRRFTGASNISGSSSLKDTSSAELLSEFCSAAVNCQYPIDNKAFDSVAWFFSNFRISVYHDEPICEIYSNCMAGQDEDKDAEPCLSENDDQYEGKSEPKKINKKAVCENSTSKRRVPAKSARSKTKSLSGMSGVNTSNSPDGQMVQDTLAACQLMPCDKAKQMKKEKVERASENSLHSLQTNGIPDSNGDIVLPNVVVKDQQTIGPATSESNAVLDKGLGTEAASEHLQSNMAPCLVDANGLNLKPGTLVVDLGIPAPAFSCLGSKLDNSLLSAESKPAPKKRKRKEKVDPTVPVQTGGIPDLNGNAVECLAPPSKPVRKRRKGEAQATALLLTFSPGVPVPSKDDLISSFCKFGPLKESETQFLKDPSSAQVVFMESADAGEAFQSLEKNNPFGTNLVCYKRFNLPSVSKVLATSLASPRTKKLLSPVPSPAKGPNLDVIRQNLQLMTSMLEKSGDTLSPEMRAKLECEIKGLLQKVSSTDGSSSA